MTAKIIPFDYEGQAVASRPMAHVIGFDRSLALTGSFGIHLGIQKMGGSSTERSA